MKSNIAISLIFWTFYYFNLVRGVYVTVRDYSGNDFFDGWDYYGFVDNTTWGASVRSQSLAISNLCLRSIGNVSYVDRQTANQQRLTYVDPNTGHAILRVDNTTNIPPAPLVNRPTVRITTKDAFDVGSLVILDATHIPYGCSVRKITSSIFFPSF